jgi:hypothetical protein
LHPKLGGRRNLIPEAFVDIDLGVLRLMEREREIPFEELVQIIEQAILTAYLKPRESRRVGRPC